MTTDTATTTTGCTCNNARRGPLTADQCMACWQRLNLQAAHRAAVAERRLPLTLDVFPCTRLGRPTGRQVDCDGCGQQGRLTAEHGCAVHGFCTVERPGKRVVDGVAKKIAWCNSCRERDSNAVQVVATADGIGDHLMALTVVAGLKRDRPDRQVVYVVNCKHSDNERWVRLFSDPDHVVRVPVRGLPELRPHETYDAQNRTRLEVPRWEHYARACGTTAALPTPIPLPADAVEWASRFTGAVVLSPFSAWRPRNNPLFNCREWLPANWLELERLLIARGERTVILDDQKDRVSMFKGDKVTGEDAARVAAVIEAGKVLVGNDSGMVHLAGARGKPAIVLCGQVRGEQVFGVWPTVKVLQGQMSCSGCHWQGKHGWQKTCDVVCANLQSIRPDDVLGMIDGHVVRRAYAANPGWHRAAVNGDTVTINHGAGGLGDALLGLVAVGAKRNADPRRQIAYAVHPDVAPFIALFDGGYDLLIEQDHDKNNDVPPRKHVGDLQLNVGYKHECRTKASRPRWRRYLDNAGLPADTSPVLPRLRDRERLLDVEVRWPGAVVLSPYSTWSNREWRQESWLTLERLLLEAGFAVLVLDRPGTSTSREEPVNRSAVFRSDKIISGTAEQVTSAVLNAACVVGNDSGIVHLAGMVGTPAVVLLGQTTGPEIFGLYPSVRWLEGHLDCKGCWWQQPFESKRCDATCANLATILPEDVVKAVKEVAHGRDAEGS